MLPGGIAAELLLGDLETVFIQYEVIIRKVARPATNKDQWIKTLRNLENSNGVLRNGARLRLKSRSRLSWLSLLGGYG